MTAEIVAIRPVYEGWGKLVIATVRLAGGILAERQIEDHGNAAGVLPYDPERRTALLVRQTRTPVLYARGEPWLLEAPAGIVEDGDPAETARREALEEVGVALEALEHVVSAWTMPGVSSERLDLYLARYAASDRTGDGGGLAEEHENIVVTEVALDQLAAMADRGEITDLKTLTMVLALRLRRPDLFASAIPASASPLPGPGSREARP